MIQVQAIATLSIEATRNLIEGVIEQNRDILRAARASETPLPSRAELLKSYVPDPVSIEHVRNISGILAVPSNIEIEEATAWRVAELREAGDESARFEIIGIFRDASPVRPQSLLIIHGDGRFENPLQP